MKDLVEIWSITFLDVSVRLLLGIVFNPSRISDLQFCYKVI